MSTTSPQVLRPVVPKIPTEDSPSENSYHALESEYLAQKQKAEEERSVAEHDMLPPKILQVGNVIVC